MDRARDAAARHLTNVHNGDLTVNLVGDALSLSNCSTRALGAIERDENPLVHESHFLDLNSRIHVDRVQNQRKHAVVNAGSRNQRQGQERLNRRFQGAARLAVLEHPQQPGGGVPVADGDAGVDRAADDLAQPALTGPADQAGEVEGAGTGVGLVDAGRDGDLGDRGLGPQRLLQEDDVVAIGVGIRAERPGRPVDRCPHLLQAAHNHARLVGERARQQLLQADGQVGHRRPGCCEEDVPALDVGGNVLEPVRLQTRAQVGHPDQVPAADVDAAQESQVLGHARL